MLQVFPYFQKLSAGHRIPLHSPYNIVVPILFSILPLTVINIMGTMVLRPGT